MSARARLLLKVVVSCGLLAIVVASIDDVGAVGRMLLDAAPLYVALAAVVLMLDRFLMSFKWLLLLRSRGLHLPLLQAVKIYCAAMIWGLFLPATIGADALRGFFTARHGLDGYEVFASITVERLVGFVVSLLFGLGGIVILTSAGVTDGRLDGIWLAGAIATLCALLGLATSFNAALFAGMVSLLPRRLRDSGLVLRLRNFHAVYRGYGRQHGVLAAFSVLTLIEQSFVVVANWMIVLALHIDVSFVVIAGAVPLSMLVSRLPVSIDGLGVYEGVMVVLLALVGVGAAEAVALSLAGRIIQTFVWLPWWFAYTVQTGFERPPSTAAHSS